MKVHDIGDGLGQLHLREDKEKTLCNLRAGWDLKLDLPTARNIDFKNNWCMICIKKSRILSPENVTKAV